MFVLAFLPQHVWEVGASVFAVLLIGQGLFWLIRGSDAPGAEGMSEGIVRLAAGFMLLIGVGIGLAALLVDAESPGAHGGDRWGGTAGVVVLGIWLALLCTSVGVSLRKGKR